MGAACRLVMRGVCIKARLLSRWSCNLFLRGYSAGVTEGARLLHLHLTGGGTAALARELRVSPQAINYWRHGKTRPSHEKIPVLRDRFGIAIEAWYVPAQDPQAAA